MDANGWAAVIGASGVVVVQITSLFLDYFREKNKLKRLAAIDTNLGANTKLTKEAADAAKVVATEATAAAVAVAKDAKVAAEIVVDKADNIARQLNGTLTTRIQNVVKEEVAPIVRAMEVHSEQDDRNMNEIRSVLADLRDKK